MPAANMGQNQFALPSSTMAEIVKSEVEILNSNDLAEATLKKLSVTSLYPDLAAAPDDVALERAVTRFGKQLQVDPIDLSNVVNVGFQSEDAAITTKVLAVLLADFQARHVSAYSTGQILPIEGQIAAKQKDLADPRCQAHRLSEHHRLLLHSRAARQPDHPARAGGDPAA